MICFHHYITLYYDYRHCIQEAESTDVSMLTAAVLFWCILSGLGSVSTYQPTVIG